MSGALTTPSEPKRMPKVSPHNRAGEPICRRPERNASSMERRPTCPCFKLERMVTETQKLTPQQEAFVANYILNDGNATQAAIQAGYSENTARHQASRLLTKVGVSKAIERKRQALAVRTEYTIATWRADLLADIEAARQSGSHSAVMKGRELLGRHIGALNDHRQLDPAEARWFTAFEQAMTQAYGDITSVSQEVSQPAIESSYTVSEE